MAKSSRLQAFTNQGTRPKLQAASATIWPDLYDSKKNEKKILAVGLFYTTQ